MEAESVQARSAATCVKERPASTIHALTRWGSSRKWGRECSMVARKSVSDAGGGAGAGAGAGAVAGVVEAADPGVPAISCGKVVAVAGEPARA